MSKYVRQEKSQRKHPVASSASSLIKAPAVPTAPKERPGFKGPGFIKKTLKQAQQPQQTKSSRMNPPVQEHLISRAHQQLLLDIVRTAFPICLDYEALKFHLQSVRQALSNGNYEQAFSRQDWIEAYVVRWSATRALCCASVLVKIAEELGEEIRLRDLLLPSGDGTSRDGRLSKIVCYGGGPTQILAFAAARRYFQSSSKTLQLTSTTQTEAGELSAAEIPLSSPLDVYLLEQANWAPVVASLEVGLVTPPVLSKYASQLAQLNNIPFMQPDDLRTTLFQRDVLTASQEDLVAILGPAPSLITIFFTLNDLHTISSAKAAALLLKTTLSAPKDTLLLIVDSAEPASEAADGANGAGIEKRTFKLGTWLDMVLMGQFGPENVAQSSPWKELTRAESRLFRLMEGLKFPISLDHVNFQMYLFKKR